MKPSDFALGVSEFFGVLLPGAFVTYLLKFLLGQADVLPADLSGSGGWFAFATAAYLLGHIVHMLGSRLDRFYDPKDSADEVRVLVAVETLRDRLLAGAAARSPVVGPVTTVSVVPATISGAVPPVHGSSSHAAALAAEPESLRHATSNATSAGAAPSGASAADGADAGAVTSLGMVSPRSVAAPNDPPTVLRTGDLHLAVSGVAGASGGAPAATATSSGPGAWSGSGAATGTGAPSGSGAPSGTRVAGGSDVPSGSGAAGGSGVASGSSTAGGSGAVGGKSPGLLMSLGINLIRLAVSWRWRPHRARHYDIPLINAYQWSKALLRLQGGEAMAEVDRLEADSKFFRSIVVLTLFTALFAVLSLGFKLGTSGPSPSPSAAVGLALGALLLGRLSFARFSDQRKKAAHRAFHLVLTLDAVKPLAPRAAKKKKPTEADDGGDEAEAA